MSFAIPLAVPHLAGNESRYLQECLDTNYVSSVGPFVERFEAAFAAWMGGGHAVACSSGTAALHVALLALGARPGAEVGVPTFTFIAPVNAVAYTGAAPFLVDSEATTWNLDAQRLHDEVVARAARGRPLPAVIEPVHILGHPADLEPLLDLRARFDIPLVEDAAEALGASYRSGPLAGRLVGTVGDIGCFSFNGNKVITSGGGGMILTNDVELAARARYLTTQARMPGPGHAHDEIGFNYRLTNLAAAVGLAQLEQLGVFLEAKRAIAARYRAALAALPVELHPHVAWAEPSHWLYSVLLEPGTGRHEVITALAAAGIEARPLWRPAHRQRPYRSSPRLGGGVADDLHERGLSLPSSVGLSEAGQDQVVAALGEALRPGPATGAAS